MFDELTLTPTIIVTGGAGFIGSNFVLDWINMRLGTVINLDLLTYASNLENLDSIKSKSHHILVEGDICDRDKVSELFIKYRPKAVINFAAESHVDRSIEGADLFVHTNINGTYNLLEASRNYWYKLNNKGKEIFRFIHISTDEVYGSLSSLEQAFTEKNQYKPNNPYAASKAASDHLVKSWFHTYGLPVIVTNCSNNYGPYQFIDKFIPKIIINCLTNKLIPIYGDGQYIRDWLYVTDHCAAIREVLNRGVVGETYNIGGLNEKTNLEVVNIICSLLDQMVPISSNIKHPITGVKLITYANLITFVKDRKGHDKRYAINASKIEQELNWKPKEAFESGIRKTVQWYIENYLKFYINNQKLIVDRSYQ